MKRQRKYKGTCRKLCNLIPTFLFLLVALLNLVDFYNWIYNWWYCGTTVTKTAHSAHFGGFMSGLATGWIVLNKFQESMRRSGRYRPEDVRECCKLCSAYIRNPDVKSLFSGIQSYKPTCVSIISQNIYILIYNCMLTTINFMIQAGE